VKCFAGKDAEIDQRLGIGGRGCLDDRIGRLWRSWVVGTDGTVRN
jgi:hypothetical protein